MNYNITGLSLSLYSDNRDFWSHKMLTVIDHFTCHSDASLLSILWYACCFQLHLTRFTMLKYILQIFPVKMQFKCVFALVIRAQTAQNLRLDLKFTIMISLLMMHKEFLHMVFTVCSLHIYVCLEVHEILIPNKMVRFVLNLLSIMYLHIKDLLTWFLQCLYLILFITSRDIRSIHYRNISCIFDKALELLHLGSVCIILLLC